VPHVHNVDVTHNRKFNVIEWEELYSIIYKVRRPNKIKSFEPVQILHYNWR